MVRLPDLPAFAEHLHEIEDGAEELLQIGEALDLKRLAAQHVVLILAAHDAIREEIDEGVGLGVDVVAVEHHLGVVEDLPQSPDERMGVGGERLVGPEGIEIDAVSLERGVVADVGEWLGTEAEARVLPAILVGERPGLIEKAEVGPLHVEAEGGHRALMARERLEDAAQQELDRAGLGRQSRYAGDVEVRGLGPEEKIAIEVDGRLEPAGGVETDRDAGGPLTRGVGVHAERQHDVLVAGQPHGTDRHRLQRLLGHLPQHRRGEQADLGTRGGFGAGRDRITVGADHGVHRRHQVGIGEAIGDHPEDHTVIVLDPHDGADADGRFARSPEMELVRRRRLELGGDYPAERRLVLGHAPMWRASGQISRGDHPCLSRDFGIQLAGSSRPSGCRRAVGPTAGRGC